MLSNYNIPPEISRLADGERIEFSVKAKRAESLLGSFCIFAFGFVFFAFGAGFVVGLLYPILTGGTVDITVNGVAHVASASNYKPIIMPVVVGSIFLMVGTPIMLWGIRSAFKEGPWVLGTANRMIISSKKSVKSYDWEQFNGNIERNGSRDNATLIFQMRTGQMRSRKNGPSRYVPDRIYIVGIPNAMEIESLCRKRIKQNDPTPAAGI